MKIPREIYIQPDFFQNASGISPRKNGGAKYRRVDDYTVDFSKKSWFGNPRFVQNKAVPPTWKQLWKEIVCSVKDHQFYVPWYGGYPGMPQAHCYRCGKVCDYMAIDSVKEWDVPNSYL